MRGIWSVVCLRKLRNMTMPQVATKYLGAGSYIPPLFQHLAKEHVLPVLVEKLLKVVRAAHFPWSGSGHIPRADTYVSSFASGHLLENTLPAKFIGFWLILQE